MWVLRENFYFSCYSIKYFSWFKALLFHKNLARSQRQAYNKQHKNYEYLEEKILIEIDYKQKMILPMSPRQVNAEYYKLQQRICLGKPDYA